MDFVETKTNVITALFPDDKLFVGNCAAFSSGLRSITTPLRGDHEA